jgi:hypothetical protein
LKLLFPILAIVICVFAAVYMFAQDQLYQYGIDQGIDAGDNSHLFSIWTTLSQMPTWLWYGAAVICVLVGFMAIVKSSA